MPTTRPRHTITETGRVAEALEALRRELGETKLDPAELLVLGAREKLRLTAERRADRERRSELRRRFAERSGRGDGIDGEAALAARDRGWQHG